MAKIIHAIVGTATLALLALPLLANAQDTDLDLRRLPWDINAETAEFDGETETFVYTGLRFSQGTTSIEAERGSADNRDQQNRVWQFSGNVVITINNGRISCDSAVLRFDGNLLSIATVVGDPAIFELKRDDDSDTTTATAGKLVYDVSNSIIEFSEDAKITESGNQISANVLIYNIAQRSFNAGSSEEDEGRVRIIYTPTDGEISNIGGEVPETQEEAKNQ